MTVQSVQMKPEQTQRYARHLSLPGFGQKAQEKLLSSSVLIVGAGGLGSPAALYLAAAGVGELWIIDDDKVELSNLQRQILHGQSRLGQSKANSAKQSLREINPDVKVVALNERLNENNARDLVSQVDVVLDGADNFPTRYLLNDAAFFEGKPLVHGSIFHQEGQLSVFHASKGPCYRCIYPTPPKPGTVPSCSEAGVLGVLPGAIGVFQATEVIKLLTGIGQTLIGKMLTYDALAMEIQKFNIQQKRACPLCGDNPSIREVKSIDWACSLESEAIKEITVSDLKSLSQLNEAYLLLDVRETHEFKAGHIPGAKNIPLGILEHSLENLKAWQNKTILCQCQSGGRSLKATKILMNKEFKNVVNLKGGYLAWLKQESK